MCIDKRVLQGIATAYSFLQRHFDLVACRFFRGAVPRVAGHGIGGYIFFYIYDYSKQSYKQLVDL